MSNESDEGECNLLLDFCTNLNSDFINSIIEQQLRYILITDDLTVDDKKMTNILINLQKKTNFTEIKYMFMISLVSSFKKIIDNSSNERSNTSFYKQGIYKAISLFVTRFISDKMINMYNKEESQIISDFITLSSKDFGVRFQYYIFREFENNYHMNPTIIKFEYQNNYNNILHAYRAFMEVVYVYIKIIVRIFSLYIMPIVFREASISTYFKTTVVNVYSFVLFNSTYKKMKINTSSNSNDDVDHIEDFFNNIYKMVEKNTLQDELKLLSEIVIQDLFSNRGKNKYKLPKFSKERIMKTRMFQLYETILSIIINQRTILMVTDGFKPLFDDFGYFLIQFKQRLKDTHFFIDIIKTKKYQISNEIEWNNDCKYVYTLRNISLEYTENENTKAVLKNVNLDFECGKTHYIYGPSGCGKSTLLLAFIKRIKINNDGSILFFGLHDYTFFSIRKHISFITCDTTLFKKSLYHNIVYGIDKNVLETKNDEIMNTIKKYMTRFDLQEFIPVIKMKNADKLSKGQEQRIIVMNLILDIMYNNKRILFLDEFTSNVDAKNEQVIFQELKTLQNMYNLTIFYVSHNSSNIVYSDYNYLINPDTLSISKQVTNK